MVILVIFFILSIANYHQPLPLDVNISFIYSYLIKMNPLNLIDEKTKLLYICMHIIATAKFFVYLAVKGFDIVSYDAEITNKSVLNKIELIAELKIQPISTDKRCAYI